MTKKRDQMSGWDANPSCPVGIWTCVLGLALPVRYPVDRGDPTVFSDTKSAIWVMYVTGARCDRV